MLLGLYLPLYTTCHAEDRRQPRRMVSFPRIPYAEAARRAGRQDRFVYGTLLAIFIVLRLVILLTFGRWRLSAWICLTLSHERSH